MDFKEAMTEDVEKVFMNVNDFAIEAVYNGNAVIGQFLEKFNEEVEAFYKLFIAKASDLSTIAVGDVIEVDGVSYGVVDFNIDDFKDQVDVFLSEEI